MVAAGMDGGRINCAHDTPDAWRRRAAELRAAATRAGRPLALLLDLAGPKMRLGTGVRPRQVTAGESVVFASGEDLLRKTPSFYANATRRLDEELGGAYQFAQTHFGGQNLYMDAVKQNIRFAERAANGEGEIVLRRQPPVTCN
jgi:pyruvate kinase